MGVMKWRRHNGKWPMTKLQWPIKSQCSMTNLSSCLPVRVRTQTDTHRQIILFWNLVIGHWLGFGGWALGIFFGLVIRLNLGFEHLVLLSFPLLSIFLKAPHLKTRQAVLLQSRFGWFILSLFLICIGCFAWYISVYFWCCHGGRSGGVCAWIGCGVWKKKQDGETCIILFFCRCMMKI